MVSFPKKNAVRITEIGKKEKMVWAIETFIMEAANIDMLTPNTGPKTVPVIMGLKNTLLVVMSLSSFHTFTLKSPMA